MGHDHEHEHEHKPSSCGGDLEKHHDEAKSEDKSHGDKHHDHEAKSEDKSHGHDHGHGDKQHDEPKCEDKSHDHGHGHKHHDHEPKSEEKGHDHGHHDNETSAGHGHHDHEKSDLDHSHSHQHGVDCDTCGPEMTTKSDVEDAPIPEWKKKALAMGDKLDSNTAPFGGSWNMESSVSAHGHSHEEHHHKTEHEHETEKKSHDHKSHDHDHDEHKTEEKGHDHKHEHETKTKGHDHDEHKSHDHSHDEHKHKKHDHDHSDHENVNMESSKSSGHDHHGHDHDDKHKTEHKGHDHHGHDHKEHDHQGHDHENVDMECADDHHDHHAQEGGGLLDHEHSHVHGEDCSDCGPTKRVLTEADVKDAPIPEWKKKALAMGDKLDSSAAPFGGNWNMESSVSATATNTTEKSSHDHSHAQEHQHQEAHDHGHHHEHLDHPGKYSERPTATTNTTTTSDHQRDFSERSFTVGLGGPVGSGKTALLLALCRKLRHRFSLGAVTNDIFTREDGEFLTRNDALPKERIMAVETGGCPHAAIREDISANLYACEVLSATFDPLDIIMLESGGDNLAANFSPELADFTVYVIDVAGGDKVPRKGGPGVTQSDVLVINKTDLAEAVGASLAVMKRDAERMRGDDGPVVFARAREGLGGEGVDDIVDLILQAYRAATGA